MTPSGPRSSSAKKLVVSLLRDLARQIQALDDSEVESVLAGQSRIEIRPPLAKPEGNRTRSRCTDEALTGLQERLRNTNTRQRARELINEILHTKAELTRFARALDIPVPKSISSEQIKDRLVEGTVGYRLRSAAIRGNAIDAQ